MQWQQRFTAADAFMWMEEWKLHTEEKRRRRRLGARERRKKIAALRPSHGVLEMGGSGRSEGPWTRHREPGAAQTWTVQSVFDIRAWFQKAPCQVVNKNSNTRAAS